MTRGVGGKSPANIMRHLKGLTFPASKADVLEHVYSKLDEPGYKDTVVVHTLLGDLPEMTYHSPAFVLEQIKYRPK